jgi:hypothetical protein
MRSRFALIGVRQPNAARQPDACKQWLDSRHDRDGGERSATESPPPLAAALATRSSGLIRVGTRHQCGVTLQYCRSLTVSAGSEYYVSRRKGFWLMRRCDVGSWLETTTSYPFGGGPARPAFCQVRRLDLPNAPIGMGEDVLHWTFPEASELSAIAELKPGGFVTYAS